MRVKRLGNPHCYNYLEITKNRKKLPPLNKYIKDRLKCLNIQLPQVMQLTGLSRSKSYLIVSGYFPQNYEMRIALASLLKTPLEKLVLWEYGLLEKEMFPNPRDGVLEKKEEVRKKVADLAKDMGLTPDELKRLL